MFCIVGHVKPFTATIDLKLAPKLKADLESQGFELTRIPYSVFSAKKKGVTCTLYESGKLTVQGKEMGEFLEFYLEPEILQSFAFSNPEVGVDPTPRIGLDEAGKGDYFGPLCIAGFYTDRVADLVKMGVCDSKQLSDEKVLKLAKSLRAQFAYTVIRLFPLKYNELYKRFGNLNRLLAWAHVAALKDLVEKTGCREAILDQFANPGLVDSMVKQKNLDVHLTQRTKGESDPVVAAASILARAAFLEGMETLSQEAGRPLPKGAAAHVPRAGLEIAKAHGIETLEKYGKTHFKTHREILAKL